MAPSCFFDVEGETIDKHHEIIISIAIDLASLFDEQFHQFLLSLQKLRPESHDVSLSVIDGHLAPCSSGLLSRAQC
jgi:hypothetical protein